MGAGVGSEVRLQWIKVKMLSKYFKTSQSNRNAYDFSIAEGLIRVIL